MNVMTYISVQKNFIQVMESVCNDHEPVIITDENTHSVVMISLNDYNAMEETAYLFRSPRNAERLIQAINEIEDGGGQEREFVDCVDSLPYIDGKRPFCTNEANTIVYVNEVYTLK